MTEKYKWLGTSDLTIPETELSVLTGHEFELNETQLNYSGIQAMIKDERIVKVPIKVTGVKHIEKIEKTENKKEEKERKSVTVKGINPFI